MATAIRRAGDHGFLLDRRRRRRIDPTATRREGSVPSRLVTGLIGGARGIREVAAAEVAQFVAGEVRLSRPRARSGSRAGGAPPIPARARGGSVGTGAQLAAVAVEPSREWLELEVFLLPADLRKVKVNTVPVHIALPRRFENSTTLTT